MKGGRNHAAFCELVSFVGLLLEGRRKSFFPPLLCNQREVMIGLSLPAGQAKG